MTVGCEPRDVATTGLGIWLKRTLGPGAVMIDIGANVGHYTSLAAELVTSAGHVYAFEPAPENVLVLRQRFNGVSQVSIVEAAVSGTSGTASFFLDRREHTRHSLAAGNIGKAGGVVQVAQVTLDDSCATLLRLDVVKIDAQGAEFQIIRGARQLLARFRPRLVLEVWPYGLHNLGGNARELLEELSAIGYATYRLSAKGRLKDNRFVNSVLQTTSRWHSMNVVALPAELQTSSQPHGLSTHLMRWRSRLLASMKGFSRP
jgi:FkbM family methyltransferase